ncbi:metalloreductase transmembrane [Lichtheimia corymbifera JMRC:FSU:9682]|uniref:ferric-chelate reductase (NADPH) n=1 Tax=Lichtheimia corymbifera JMRC:FSU:9682 TaxID=1263082 RepID=A0A068S2I1_9FUNG|nr:metalloreductase transmembrane [Lichtheimia corymbifera JMRC:FSU:9682]
MVRLMNRHLGMQIYPTQSFTYIRHSSLFGKYNRLERYIVNKCSYTLNLGSSRSRLTPVLPPVGAILLILALVTTAVPLLLVQTDLAINSNRAGFLAISIVPFMLASTGKNSAMALLTGISHVKLNFLHRTLATAIVVLATVHMAYMIENWSRFSWFLKEKLATEKVQHGLAGYGCLCFVFVTSLYPIRRYCHELFLVTHLVGFGFLGAIAKHTPYAMRYFFAGLLCYCVNALTGWFVKSRIGRARVEVLPHGCTRLSLRLSSPITHRPGQHVYISLPKVSYVQWHPFTITSVHRKTEDNACDMIEMYACVRGNFTRKLYKLAQQGEEWPAFIAGPYGNGSPDLDPTEMLTHHDTLLLLGAGAGVTFPMRLVRELGLTLLEGGMMIQQQSIRTKDIYFAWSVRHVGELEWFYAELQQLLVDFEHARKRMQLKYDLPHVHVLLYVTDTNKQGADNIIELPTPPTEKAASLDGEGSRMFSNVDDDHVQDEDAPKPRVVFGSRMDVRALFKETGGREPGIFACGPASFNASIKNAVASATRPGYLPHLHCEEFQY